MLDDSSGNAEPPAKKQPKGWGAWGALFLGLSAFFLPMVVVAAIAPLVARLNLSDNIASFVHILFYEAATIGVIALFVRAYSLKFTDIGLGAFKNNYWALAGLGFLVYIVLTVAISAATGALFNYDQNQTQNLGFAKAGGLELVLVFVALVVLAPLAEELLFRGFIFKGFRRRMPFWVTALLVSAMFAVVHGQLNVGFDVFALSLVLCYLREKSGSVWPGMLLHAGKNALAFVILFVVGGSPG